MQILGVLISSFGNYRSNKIDQSRCEKELIGKPCHLRGNFDKNTDKLCGENIKNMCSIHLNCNLKSSHIHNLLTASIPMGVFIVFWPRMGRLVVNIPELGNEDNIKNRREISKLYKTYNISQARESVEECLEKVANFTVKESIKNKNRLGDKAHILSDFQTELFSIMSGYHDLFYPQQSFENIEEIRVIYCLHILNHIIENQSEIYLNNCKMESAMKNGDDNASRSSREDNNYRDQGLVRAKVLLLLPFRSSALKVIEVMTRLLCGQNTGSTRRKSTATVRNLKRFLEEYGENTVYLPKKNSKTDDYTNIFNGNTDDNFKIGIKLRKRNLSLYTDFYSSDVIIASPLGLRTMIGASGDSVRDFDFLNSIEILILDQADIFLAQNWDHVLHIMDHLHLKPQICRTRDYSRVRTWCLKGLSRLYRQTFMFTSHELPEFRALFENKCFNYRGKISISNAITNGSIQKILIKTPQVFYKIGDSNFQDSFCRRFKYFIKEILPKFRNRSVSHCMIYIPNYFDFVRIRNYFRTETINFVQICEYTTKEKVTRARDLFYHGRSQFLLYSERYHFFRRSNIKGVRHLIFYQPPLWPYLYPEIVNLMKDSNQNNRDNCDKFTSITILHSNYDILQINAILGSKNALKLLKSNNTSHVFLEQ